MTARLTALAITAALALTGCGGGDERTIPRDEGNTLIRLLRDARDQAGDLPDECDALQETVSRVQAEVEALPGSVDDDTRNTLTQGADNLAQTAREECEDVDTETETTPTVTEPTPTETEPPTETETVPPPTETETETAPPPAPPEPPPESNGNGNGNGNSGNGNGDGGFVPPGQQKKGRD